MKYFNKFKSRLLREKEKSLLCAIVLILGVFSLLYALTEILIMLMRINYYIYTNRLFIFNQMICILLFGVSLILLGIISIKPLKTNRMKKILEMGVCLIGIILIAASSIAIPNVIDNGYKISFYLPLFVFFFLIGIILMIYTTHLLIRKKSGN